MILHCHFTWYASSNQLQPPFFPNLKCFYLLDLRCTLLTNAIVEFSAIATQLVHLPSSLKAQKTLGNQLAQHGEKPKL